MATRSIDDARERARRRATEAVRGDAGATVRALVSASERMAIGEAMRARRDAAKGRRERRRTRARGERRGGVFDRGGGIGVGERGVDAPGMRRRRRRRRRRQTTTGRARRARRGRGRGRRDARATRRGDVREGGEIARGDWVGRVRFRRGIARRGDHLGERFGGRVGRRWSIRPAGGRAAPGRGVNTRSGRRPWARRDGRWRRARW